MELVEGYGLILRLFAEPLLGKFRGILWGCCIGLSACVEVPSGVWEERLMLL